MRANKVIVFTAFDRPHYAKQTVESLRCCYGIEDYLIIPFVEPVHQEVIDLFSAIDYAALEMRVNAVQQGHTQNTYNAMEYGFTKSDYVILLESDDLFAPDFLRFHEFCRDRYRDDTSVYTVAGGHYRHPKRITPSAEFHAYELRSGFSNRGWGTWIDRWDESGGMRDDWEAPEIVAPGVYKKQYKYRGWDWHLNCDLRGERVEAVPILSRVKNIGWSGGRHTGVDKTKYNSIEDWYAENVDLAHWAGDEDILDNSVYALR